MKWRTVIVCAVLLLIMGAVFSKIQQTRLASEKDKAQQLSARDVQQTADIERLSSEQSRLEVLHDQDKARIGSLQSEAASEDKLLEKLERHFEELRVAEGGVTSRRDYLEVLEKERKERLEQSRKHIEELETVVLPEARRQRDQTKIDLEDVNTTQGDLKNDFKAVKGRVSRSAAHVERLEDKLKRWKAFVDSWNTYYEYYIIMNRDPMYHPFWLLKKLSKDMWDLD